jgi:hypothetical protein
VPASKIPAFNRRLQRTAFESDTGRSASALGTAQSAPLQTIAGKQWIENNFSKDNASVGTVLLTGDAGFAYQDKPDLDEA